MSTTAYKQFKNKTHISSVKDGQIYNCQKPVDGYKKLVVEMQTAKGCLTKY